MPTYDPVFVSINERPAAVLSVMDSLQARRQAQAEAVGRRARVPRWLFLAGLPFLALDWLLGYNCMTFTLVTVGLWVAAAFTWYFLRRARPGGPFPPHFATAREVLYTLRDDPDPGRPVFGHVDLSGAQQPAKRFRTGTNAAGRAMEYYRDEWLSLKAKLYDGNMLRLAAIERVKVRKSYLKRSLSGKYKTKPAKVANEQEIKVRVSVNPEVYAIAEQPSARPGTRVGNYTITGVSTAGGIVEVGAGASTRTITPPDILGVLRVAYDQLQRKAAA